jgi:hypothetical protein
MKTETQNTYQQRVEMNMESSMTMRLLGLLQETDILVLSAQFEKAEGPDKLEMLRKEVKGELRETKKELKELRELIAELG